MTRLNLNLNLTMMERRTFTRVNGLKTKEPIVAVPVQHPSAWLVKSPIAVRVTSGKDNQTTQDVAAKCVGVFEVVHPQSLKEQFIVQVCWYYTVGNLKELNCRYLDRNVPNAHEMDRILADYVEAFWLDTIHPLEKYNPIVILPWQVHVVAGNRRRASSFSLKPL